ncbi:MAG TPA: hypothetical protein VMV10_29620 [Pirellulales bacterium]|nr:hypothetical protein [Pirellulales bacterium]
MKNANAREIVRWLGVAALGLAAAGCNAPAATQDAPASQLPAAAAQQEPAENPAPRQEGRAPPPGENDPAPRQPEEERPADYLPLSADSRWIYDVTIDLPVVGSQKASAVTKVEGSVEIDGKTYYKVVMQVSGAPVNPKHVAYFRPTAQGVFQILEGEEEHGEWLYLPRRLEIGQKWSAETGESKFEFEVAGRRDVDCLGKTYENCVQIVVEMHGKFGSMKQEQWLAPGVGPVKQVDHHTLFDSTAVLKNRVASEPQPQSPAQ